MYWSITNIISVGQARLLRLDRLRNYFGIEKPRPPPKGLLPPEQKGAVDTIKDGKLNFGMN